MTTTYRVLRRNQSGSLSEVGAHECNGPTQAIRHFVEQSDTPDVPVRFIAVPARNWSEIEIAAEEQKPKLVMKEVDPASAQTTIDDVLGEPVPA